MLLVGRQEGHSLTLTSVKSRLVPFWYWLTRVVPEKGQLNGCVCLCSVCNSVSNLDIADRKTGPSNLRFHNNVCIKNYSIIKPTNLYSSFGSYHQKLSVKKGNNTTTDKLILPQLRGGYYFISEAFTEFINQNAIFLLLQSPAFQARSDHRKAKVGMSPLPGGR